MAEAGVIGVRAPYSRTLFELLDEQAGRYGDGMAAVSGEQNLSYAALAHRARQAGAVLQGLGVRRGERVGLLISNRAEWLELAFGTWMLGASVAAFSTWSTQRELEFLLRDSNVSVFVALPTFARENYATMLRALLPEAADDAEGWHSERFPAMRTVMLLGGDHGFRDYIEARENAEPLPIPPPGDGASASDDAIILYTSGSTSLPKAVPVAHYQIIENGFNIGERQGLGPADRVLLSPPLFWAYGGINAMPATFTHGATLVLQTRFEAGEALGLIERHRCTSIYTLPGMTDAIVRHPEFDLDRTRSLRKGMTLGSPQEVIKAAVALGVSGICNIYGSSETGGNCCVTPHQWPLERRANCQGPPLPGVKLRIVDEISGELLGPGQPGLVEVKGPYVMRGYIGSSAAQNAVTFTDDGWFRSGDIAQLTPAAEFVFVGRSTEMIKRAGINVSPAEVEDILMQHPQVAQVGVVGVPSEKGESIIAFVVGKTGASFTPDDLATHCRALASGYKVPDRFELVETLPTTVTGKLIRRELKSSAVLVLSKEG